MITNKDILVIVLCRAWSDWHDALEDSEVWNSFIGVSQVIHVNSLEELSSDVVCSPMKKVIIPLYLDDKIPDVKGYFSLIPSAENVDAFYNKNNFYRFMSQNGLESFIPKTSETYDSNISFPFVLKRSNLSGGYGVEVVENRESMEQILKQPVFAEGSLIFQEYIEGEVEYVTHVICREGQIVFHTTFEGPVPREKKMNRGPFAENIAKLDPEHFQLFEKIFFLCKYSGPACINFKITQGRPVLFEINPRFGGSIFRHKFREQLKEAIRTFLDSSVLITSEVGEI